jgi:hypothetical protein
MAINQESFNNALYDLLTTRGYNPVPLNAKGDKTPVSQEADVFKFDFKKGMDGSKNYGPVWVTIDNASNLIVYYDDSIADSGNVNTSGTEFSDTWTSLLQVFKKWAMRKQLGFELKNRDHLASDMAQRLYIRKKEGLGESYHPMGKKSSYNDTVPQVKIIIQHTRQIEEGEKRFHNIEKIFVENTLGERFAIPTRRPGIAKVYARHIAEGGTPYDERGKHITSLVEEYTKMAGFVRATRNNTFSESAQKLVLEGINHYHSLRETLSRMIGHRGYNAYFENWSPTLMETEGDEMNINELFVKETLDPRIESAMPILKKLSKNIKEVTEVKELEEWANKLVDEATDLKSIPEDDGHTEEENSMANDNLNKMAKASKKIGKKVKGMGNKGSLQPWQQQLVATAADKVDAVYHSMDDEELEEGWNDRLKNPDSYRDHVDSLRDLADQLRRSQQEKPTKEPTEKDEENDGKEVAEGLDANQRRAGQLGPTEKVGKNEKNLRGKLVGCESTELDEEPIEEGIGKYLLAGALALASIWGIDARLAQKQLDKDPQLQKLVQLYNQAKADNDEEKMEEYQHRIEMQKDRLELGYGPVMGPDGKPKKVVPEELKRIKKLSGI